MPAGRLAVSALFLFFMLYSVIPGSHFFSWHPTLMTLGYGFFMYQAILMFTPEALFPNLKKPTRVTFHWVLQVLALTCAAAGASVAFYNKTHLGKPHFVTWHAKVGLATNLCAFGAALGGTMAKYSNKVKVVPTLTLKTCHAAFACVTYALAACAIVLGLNSDYFTGVANKVYGTPLWKVSALIPPVLLASIVFQVVRSYAPRYGKL